MHIHVVSIMLSILLLPMSGGIVDDLPWGPPKREVHGLHNPVAKGYVLFCHRSSQASPQRQVQLELEVMQLYG